MAGLDYSQALTAQGYDEATVKTIQEALTDKTGLTVIHPLDLALKGLADKGVTALVFDDGFFQEVSRTTPLMERDFSTDQRQELAKSGKAMPDGSFPIEDQQDVENAVKDFGRSGARPEVKAHIKKRAKAIGCSDCLPDAWKNDSAQESAQLTFIKTIKEAFGAQFGLKESVDPAALEVVDVYKDAVIVAGDLDGDKDQDLYRAEYKPSGDTYLFQAPTEWTPVEVEFIPAEAPTAEPTEHPVPYTGELVAQSFQQTGYEITDIYPGYVLALKEGVTYKFDFEYKDGAILFETLGLPRELPAVDYSGEAVVEAWLPTAEGQELTDVFPGYVVTREADGTRQRFDFVKTEMGFLFKDPVPVQALITPLRVLETEKSAPLREANSKLRTLYLSEALDITEAGVDRAKGEIDVTLIRPGWSLNGRYYGAEVLKRTASIWDSLRAYGNHPTVTESKELPERSIWDQIGYYKNARWEDGRVRATLKLVGDESKTNHILDWAEESVNTGRPLMGLSINAVGKTAMGVAEGRRGVIVEDLNGGNSVDVVTTPSAGGSFDHLLASDDGFTNLLIQNLEFDEWREARPDFVQRLRNELKTARKDELSGTALQESKRLHEMLVERDADLEEAKGQVNRVETELTNLRAQLAEVQKTALIDQKLIESKLPADWTVSLRPTLLGAKAEELDALIAVEKSKYFKMPMPVTVKEAGRDVPSGQPDLSNRIAESLGVAIVPGPFESPQQYEKRKQSILAQRVRGSK